MPEKTPPIELAKTPVRESDRFDLRTLYETSQLLSASLDLTFVLNNLLLTAMSKLLVTRAAVWLVDEDSSYGLAACKGSASPPPEERLELEPGQMDGLTLEDGLPSVLCDASFRVAAPIRFGSREVGLLCLGSKATRQPFDERELEFVKSLVNMSSAAVHNSMIVDELRHSNQRLDQKIQQLNTLFDISQEFNATVDRQRVARLLSFALMGQMMVRRHVFVLRRDGDANPFQVVSSSGLATEDLNEDTLRSLCELTDKRTDRDEDVRSVMAGAQLALALPIRHQGSTCALLGLGAKANGARYGDDDIEFLYSLGNLAFVSIQNSFLVDEQIEKERLEEEMRLARKIQEQLMPDALPAVARADLAIVAVPSRHVAGDYLDLVALEEERLLMAIGDVTGKGLPASLLMSNIQACLHTMLPMELTLEEATHHMNRVICSNTSFDRFITYFHAIYYARDAAIEYVNAGHDPPMLIRNGTVERLSTGGLLLGVMAGQSYERGRVDLQPDDLLVMFTDGVTEAMSPDSEEFTEERLIEVLLRHAHEKAQEVLDAVVEAVGEHTQARLADSDDMTMMVFKYCPE